VKPRRVLLRTLVEPPEFILALGRADERSPSLTISQHGTDDLVPDLWLHIRELIEDDTIQIRTPKRIRIVSAV
jgi:hypothetical protein